MYQAYVAIEALSWGMVQALKELTAGLQVSSDSLIDRGVRACFFCEAIRFPGLPNILGIMSSNIDKPRIEPRIKNAGVYRM